MTKDNDIKINLKESSVAEFTRRPLPTDEEVKSFEDRVIEEDEEVNGVIEMEDDERDEEIEESLNEIYQDDKGQMVDVKHLDVKKRRGFIFWFFSLIIFVGLVGAGVFYFYNYFYINVGTDATALEFTIEGKTEVTAGEEFFYTLTYKNLSNIVITNAQIEVTYPDNFVFLDSFPESNSEDNRLWDIMSIPAQSVNTVKIKGSMVGNKDKTEILLASIRYMPANFSSEFKKEATLTTTIQDIGLELDLDYLPTALVGNEHEIDLVVSAKEDSYINNFRVSLEPQENIEILNNPKDETNDKILDYSSTRPGVWLIENISTESKILPIKIKILEKLNEGQELVFNLEKPVNDSEYQMFNRLVAPLEILKSDLNLTLIINGSREDQGVNLGDTLNYSIVYNNKGETELKNVTIMAVLESDFLDFTSLSDPLSGVERGNTLAWTKAEIPELEVLEKHEEGMIDFSISLLESGVINADSDYSIKSYAQYMVGQSDDDSDDEEKTDETNSKNEDNRSNVITNAINSDLKLIETVRYFSEDNIPVGTGPHPPLVNETTTYKVYWEINNNLHELSNASVSVILPENVSWGAKERSTVGDVTYDSSLHAIIWDIGRMPVSVFSAEAEFSLEVKPDEDDKNKIMVLLPGSTVSATDSITNAEIKKQSKAKTTKLEDDEIAEGDGIVE